MKQLCFFSQKVPQNNQNKPTDWKDACSGTLKVPGLSPTPAPPD